MISIDFEVETERGVYRDAIVLPDDHNLTPADIENLKSARVASWLAFVESMSQYQPDNGGV